MKGKNIFVVKDTETKQIVDQYSHNRSFENYTEEEGFLRTEFRRLRKIFPYPRYEIIEGVADSVEDFLEAFPEYLLEFQNYRWN